MTCGLVAATFDKEFQCKAAVALLDAMVKGGTQAWTLPAPNEYVFSSVISACARCNEYDMALEVLERMRLDESCSINTWVYNAALKACVGVSRRSRKKRVRQSQMALTLLNEMQQDFERGLDTAPDSVSYNTALAAIEIMEDIGYGDQMFTEPVKFQLPGDWTSQELTTFGLLEQMKQKNVPRDVLTYHNAIKAVRSNTKAVMMMLDDAIEDLQTPVLAGRKLTGHASQGMTFVFHSALSALSSRGDLKPIASIFSKMAENNVETNSETVIHMLDALGRSGSSKYIPATLQGLGGDDQSLETVKQQCQIDISTWFTSGSELTLKLKHYSAAIKACLAVNDIDNALKVLSVTRENDFPPDTESLQEIAETYCRLATIASAEESKIGRRIRKSKKNKRSLQMDIKQRVSAARARSALDITLALENPSIHVLSTVSKACCSAGMWAEGRMMLGRIHNAAVISEQLSDYLLYSHRSNHARSILPGLHRSLLKLCASKGNATAALGFVDDIQALSKSLSSTSTDIRSNEELLLSSFFEDATCDDDINVASRIPEVTRVDGDGSSYFGMKGEDWKLLLIAASKAGHWRLCLGTLQFLKPFLEATRPDNETDSNRKWLFAKYEKLARSLTAAILCFEMRGQYAWAIRAIEDWIDWSGRRPRKEAVLAAFRILATRGQGYEVNRLLSCVLEVPSTYSQENEAACYEEILCTGALNSLHAHGLYEDSDVIYVQACTQGYLPFEIERTETSDPFVLDLHGMNVAMAHSAVRIALKQYALPGSQDGDIVIVTGRGMNSAQRLRPILRPEVQRMLLEEFYPPLSTNSIPGNMGALRVASQDIKEWVMEQRQQKGARMLAIADVLKNLSSGERIRKTIALTLRAPEDDKESS